MMPTGRNRDRGRVDTNRDGTWRRVEAGLRAMWTVMDGRSVRARHRQRIHVQRRLLSRHPEVLLAGDIIAVKHAAGHVPGHSHGYAFGHARAHHVPGRGATEVVEQLVRDPGSLAGGSPGLSEISHRLPLPVEHQRGDSDVAVLLE